MKRAWEGMSFVERHNNLSDNITSSKSTENLKSDQQRDGHGIAKRLHSTENQSNLSSSTPNLSNSCSGSRLLPLLLRRKCFYLPEEKIRSNELAKIRQHFESHEKQHSTGISNISYGAGKIVATENHDKSSFDSLKGSSSTASNNSNQKNSRASESAADHSDQSSDLERARITAQALIKSNNLIECGRNDSECGENATASQQQASCLASGKHKHHHSRDLKPIKAPESSQQQQEPTDLILRSDDCELLQDEQEPTTCVHKNSHPPQHDDKNCSKIYGFSTTNSGFERKHNLNLDLYFDKELSAWYSRRQQIQPRNDKIAITSSIRVHDELHSSEKLSNAMTSTVAYNDSSNAIRHSSDSFSSSSTEIDTPLIDTRRHDCMCKDGTKAGRIFTDGEFIYGPYDFDLFCNEFYQFDDDSDNFARAEWTNDDRAEKHEDRRVINTQLLKNHDEVDNKFRTEVSCVRDRKGRGTLRNRNNRVDIAINVTNCSDDDEPNSPTVRNDDVAFDKNFNYVNDRSLIDLMDEGDNYVSSNRPENLHGDLQNARPTIPAVAENFDAPFILAKLPNNAPQFNYERDEMAEIADENEYLCDSSAKAERCSGENFSNEQQREFIFVDNDRHSDDDTKNKIRFDANRQPGGSPPLHPMDTKCDELDNRRGG